MLFNSEPAFQSTGWGSPSHSFYDDLFTIVRDQYKKLNLEKYGIDHDRAINAGVFLGKKDTVLQMCKEAYEYMSADQNLKFPYGCEDDQYMFRYIQNLHFDKIACDIYNKYFLFVYPKCIEDRNENDWEHFQYFSKNYLRLYKK